MQDMAGILNANHPELYRKAGRILAAAAATLLCISSCPAGSGEIKGEWNVPRIAVNSDLNNDGRLERIVISSSPMLGLAGKAKKLSNDFYTCIGIYDNNYKQGREPLKAFMKEGAALDGIDYAIINGMNCIEIKDALNSNYLCFNNGYGLYEYDQDEMFVRK